MAPKKAKVAALQAKLESSNQILQEKEAEVAKVKANVNKLRQESDLMLQKKNDTEHLIKQTMIRLENAALLTSLLKEEGERWQESIKSYEEETITVVGDMFLATGILNYCSAFTGLYRQELLGKWVIGLYSKNVPLSSENPSIVKILGNPIIIREWTINGLPSDVVSLENAVFANKASKYPLFIDPQLQAKKWLKKSEESNGLKLMKFSDNQFQTNLKAALTLGYPVLIQDTEDILDPVLDTVLGKTIYKSNDGRVSIRFADQDVEFNDGFRLYLTTKMPNPDYLPDIFIKTNVINFTVTFDGLEEQLLADVVKHERPSIEHERDENIVNLSGFRKKIIDSENLILKLLSDAKSETLLDDVDLIKTLQSSKTAAIEVDKQIKASVELEQNIEKARNLYKEVSIRGSVLYFVIKDLSLIDPMYQYSLQYITKLFNMAIHATKDSEDLIERIKGLIDNITRHIFTNVCRGLFEEHKLIFSFIISVNIKKQAKFLDEALWNIFLRGLPQISTDKKQASNNKPPDPHINAKFWEISLFLQANNPKFNNFCHDLPSQLPKIQNYINSLESNETLKFPEPWDIQFDEFEQLLIVFLYHPEKLMFAISNYIKQTLGSFYLESPEVGMTKLFNDSDCKTPIIFVLSQGADPTDSIIAFAKEKDFEEQLHIISLGQGQGPFAEKMIEEGRKSGHWVFLQNCHLARTWMPKLELILEDLNSSSAEDTNLGFRLYLTSMPTTYFPISVLQNGIKLTTEPPRGIKANLRRAFADINEEFLGSCNKGAKVFHKMIWGLAYFHAIVLERRKFGPLGWNIRYEFNDSDLMTSKTVMLMLLNEQEQIPWEALVFVTGHINYGGRVTDDWDRRCLLSILKKFYINEALEDSYRFCDSEFFMPTVGDLPYYKNFIEALPNNDDPEIFGLHANANINYQSQESQRIIASLLMIEPRVSSGGGSSGSKSDEIVLQLLDSVSKELSDNLMKENGNKDLFQENELGLLPSLSTVLVQEIERFNKLLSRMRSTMQGLTYAIQGLGLMSQDLDEMYYSLLLNQVPRVWEEVAYPSLKPLASWIADLKERLNFMSDWLLNGNPNCFWLSGFYFPQGFLTGVLQTHARKYKIPIDQLQFSFRIMEEKENIFGKPMDGVYVSGLFLVGASWDKKKKTLMNQMPGEMKFKMPVIHFSPIENYEQKNTDYM